MSVTTEGDSDKEMTLAFALSAIGQFENPGRVFEDARTWSRWVGIVDNYTDRVAAYVREYDLQQDFDLGERDKWLALQDLHDATDTDRHVFIGTTEDDRRAAEFTGWEFLTVHDVAEKAGWELDPDAGDPDTTSFE